MSEWNRISQHPPVPLEPCWVWPDDNGEVALGSWSPYIERFTDEEFIHHSATHWIPIAKPQPPQRVDIVFHNAP